MNTTQSIALEVTDLSAAEAFYTRAFPLTDLLELRHSDAATSGCRRYTLSLITSQPANAQLLFDDAVAAGAIAVKPVAKVSGCTSARPWRSQSGSPLKDQARTA